MTLYPVIYCRKKFDVINCHISPDDVQLIQGSKMASHLGVPHAAGQVKILIFLVKINFSPVCQ